MNTLPPENINPLQRAVDLIGPYILAKECGIKGPSVYKWLARGHLPRTEWTGETNYAAIIERLTNGAVTRAQLLERRRSNQTGAGDPLSR